MSGHFRSSAGFQACCVADFQVGRASEPLAGPQVWKPALQQVWKPAIRQAWKPALQRSFFPARYQASGLPQEPACWRGHARRNERNRFLRGGGSLSEGGAASGTKILVQFAGGKHEQELFPHGLGGFALGTINFAGGKSAELFLHFKSLTELDDNVQNIPQHFQRLLGSVDGMHELRPVVVKHRPSVPFIRLQPLFDHFEIGIV